MTASPLPEWPDSVDPDSDLFVESPDAAWLVYERARADFWEARCRLAVDALRGVNVLASVRTQHSGGKWATHHEDYVRNTAEILTAIGELPKP